MLSANYAVEHNSFRFFFAFFVVMIKLSKLLFSAEIEASARVRGLRFKSKQVSAVTWLGCRNLNFSSLKSNAQLF